jgi:hypothetical protein
LDLFTVKEKDVPVFSAELGFREFHPEYQIPECMVREVVHEGVVQELEIAFVDERNILIQ